jgi:plastocyanin
MSHLWRGAALMAVSLLLIACSAGPDASAAPVATDQVDLPRSYKFAPADIAVALGTTVTWTNNDQFTHSVRLLDDGGEVLVIKPGESVSHRFEQPGLRHYDCSFHPHDMKGTVLVTGG